MSRLDVFLFEQGLFESRESAKRNIMAGNVLINGQVVDKAGTQVKKDDVVTVKEKDCPYVSRGGLKLEKAIKTFQLDLKDVVAMDVGASTGGFTDCMLQNGARKVYAVDVGYGQLDWRMRNDPRVVSMERTNFRYLEKDQIGEWVDFLVMDVSFISVTKLISAMSRFLKPSGQAMILVKPQFEAGKDRVGKNGIVRDPRIHIEVLDATMNAFQENGWNVKGLDFSPIQGAKGNIEYLMLLENGQGDESAFTPDPKVVVSYAEDYFSKDVKRTE